MKDIEFVRSDAQSILKQIEKLPESDKKLILASLQGMLIVANVNKEEQEESA